MPKSQRTGASQPAAKPGDIFLVDQPRLRSSTYPHYCIVIRIVANRALVNFMSSEFKLFKDDLDIAIYESDDDFKETGLRKSSYVINEEYALVDIPLSNLFTFGGPIGRVTGKLKEKIEDWWGENL